MQKSIYSFHNRTDVRLGTRARYPRAASSVSQLIRKMQRDHQDRDIGKKIADRACDIDSIEIRHLVVERNQIGLALDSFGQRASAPVFASPHARPVLGCSKTARR